MNDNNNLDDEVIPQKTETIKESGGNIENNSLKVEEVKQENSKNNGGKILIIIAVVLVIACAVFYVVFLKPKYDDEQKQKEDNTSQNSVLLTSDEAISIAKEKLELAHTSNLVGDTCFDGNNKYSENGFGSAFCYYGTLDSLKNKFYNVYSSKLDYKDVLVEYHLPSEQAETNISSVSTYDLIQGYAIDGDKVYTNSCMAGAGSYKRMDKFTIDNLTENTIKVNYVIVGNSLPEIPEESEEYEIGNASMTLVKENNDWKITKATIVDMCNGVYEVGKE